MTEHFSCPLCGSSPMGLRGNAHGEQYYRCPAHKCYGSRDAEGSWFREESTGAERHRRFARTNKDGHTTYLFRDETGPTGQLQPIPGQPGLYRDPVDPGRIVNAADFFVDGKRFCRGDWHSDFCGSLGRALTHATNEIATKLELLMIESLAAEPQRTVARMFAVVNHRELPRIHIPSQSVAVNINAPATSKPLAEPEAPEETPMEETKKSTKTKIIDQGKDIGSAVLDGLAEATVEEAGDILLDMAQELFDGEAILTIFLATPDGREFVKGAMALMLDSVAVHTNIPKGEALRKLAKYQFRSSARRVGGPRIKKVMKRFSKLIELSERLPELPEGKADENVLDFAAAKVAAR